MKKLFSDSRIAAALANYWIALAAALLFVCVPTSAMAEYKLQSGDILEISVAGVPDLRQRSPIGLDGEIDLALVGPIKIDRMSASEARAKIIQELSNKLYQQSTNDGHEIQHLIQPNMITVTVAEYHPIYVSGDVAKPGEYPFRPGMTVRHAIAIAGGYDLVRVHLANPVVQSAEFRSEYESLWAELATEQARIWRLRTELGEKGVEYAGNKAPISPELAQQLQQAETEHLKARQADREKDKALLQDAIAKADLQLNVLTEKKRKDEEGNQADTADFEKIRELSQRGIAQAARLSEVRRATLLSSEQLLQTIVEISNVERARGEYVRQREKVDSQNRIDDWRDLQASNLRAAEITARLKSAAEKLMYSGILQSEQLQGTGNRSNIKVHRKGDDDSEHLIADEDTELAPGDVVDVALDTKSLVQALTPSKDGRP